MTTDADRIAELERELVAVRTLMNCYNLGGWTDSIGPMKRALEAEAQLAECRKDSNAVVGGLVGLLKSIAVMGEIDFNYNGRKATEVVSEILAADTLAEMKDALGIDAALSARER
jgi:hypothetical protein